MSNILDIIKNNMNYVDSDGRKFLHVSLNAGIGDILYAYHVLEHVKSRYHKIKFYVHYNNLICRNNNEGAPVAVEFTRNLVDLCFGRDARYLQVDQPLATGPICNQNFCKLLDIPSTSFAKPDWNFLCDNSSVSEKNYVIVHTKARGVVAKNWHDHKQEFVNALTKISERHTVIFMGDRSIDFNKNVEYRNFTQCVYCIYDHIKNIIDGNKFLNMTRDNVMDQPNFKNYRRDCTYIKNAHAVIQLGIGGSFVTSVGLTSNCYSLLDRSDTLVPDVVLPLCKGNKYNFDFLNFCKEIHTI